MDVTDVLRDRAQAPDGLQRMVMLSFAVHIVFVAACAADAWHAHRPPR